MSPFRFGPVCIHNLIWHHVLIEMSCPMYSCSRNYVIDLIASLCNFQILLIFTLPVPCIVNV